MLASACPRQQSNSDGEPYASYPLPLSPPEMELIWNVGTGTFPLCDACTVLWQLLYQCWTLLNGIVYCVGTGCTRYRSATVPFCSGTLNTHSMCAVEPDILSRWGLNTTFLYITPDLSDKHDKKTSPWSSSLENPLLTGFPAVPIRELPM